MPVVNYTTVNGRILHEDRGGVKTLFMPDTLGTVIETRNMDAGAQTSSTTYWPYGEVRTQTGTNPSPFGFCGVWGYYTQSGQPTYVRARHYRPNLGRWQTVDPLWPLQSAYRYVGNNPSKFADPTGLVYPSLVPADAIGDWERVKKQAPGARGQSQQDWVNAVVSVEAFIRMNPCLWCAKYARSIADFAINNDELTRGELNRRFPGMPANGGTPRNAVMHCASACYASLTCGRRIAEEYLNSIYEGFLLLGNFQDKYNNARGFQCADSFIGPGFTPKDCLLCCLRHYDNHRLL